MTLLVLQFRSPGQLIRTCIARCTDCQAVNMCMSCIHDTFEGTWLWKQHTFGSDSTQTWIQSSDVSWNGSCFGANQAAPGIVVQMYSIVGQHCAHWHCMTLFRYCQPSMIPQQRNASELSWKLRPHGWLSKHRAAQIHIVSVPNTTTTALLQQKR